MARPKEKQEEEKKETGKKYLPVQSSTGTKGQTAQERAKEILSMSREEQKARNQARLREALNRSAQSRPASSAQTEAMRRNFAKREQKEEYRRRYGTPQSSREAREQQAWQQQQRKALEQYQSYFEKYGQKPTEEQVQNNPVLSDIGQLWKANTAQVQATQKAWEEIENTRIPSKAGRELWTAAQNANTMGPLERARAREQEQLSEEDQAFANNAYSTLKGLYEQQAELEAKGDTAGLAEVNKRIANEETILRRLGLPLPGEVEERAAVYGENTKEHFDRYIKAVEDAEKIDAMLKADMEKYPEAYNAYLKAKEKVGRGETLTEQELLDYEGWASLEEQAEEARAEAKALEDGGVLESVYGKNAYSTLKGLYEQQAELEAKGDTAGLAEVNKRIANEETILRRLGLPLPGEVEERAAVYGENTKEHFDRYIKAVEDAEKIDAMLKADMEKYPEAYNAYLKAKEKVGRGETLTEQELLDYEGWASLEEQAAEARAEAQALADGGVLEEGYSYAERDRQRVNEGQLTQVEELSQYAGTMQAPIARQEASKLLTELYNQQYKLKKDIAAMELAGITGPAMDNAKDQLETVERQIAEGEYAMLRFEDDFAGKSAAPAELGWGAVEAGIAQNMTEMELATYNYLRNTKGMDAAKQYVESIKSRLLKRETDKQMGVVKKAAEHPVGSWITSGLSIAVTPLEWTGAVKAGVDNMLGRDTSPYDPAFATTHFKNTVRETVMEGQRKAFGDGLGGQTANLVYQVFMTAGDSAISMATGGAVGKALQGAGVVAQGANALAKAGNSVGSALMALSAVSGKTQQELLLGRDNSQALVQGLAAGVTEYITEKLGMDRLTAAFSLGKGGGYRTILANVIKSFAPEALEELPGNVVDLALDNYLNGDSSQRAESIKQKIAAGMSVTQATVETDMEFVVETLQGMLVGGLSGSLGAGVSTSVGMIKARSARTALTEAGVDADTAQAAAERISGLRSDAASEQAVRAAVEQIQQAEAAKGVKHTPFAAEATAAGYEDVPVKVTGFQGIRDGAAWVEIEIAGKGKGEIRLDQVRFADTDTQTAYNRAAMFGDTQTARRFLAGYEATSMPMEIYGQAFQSAYQAGQNSRAMTEYERKAGFGTMLEDGVYRIAYQAGQEATVAQEARLEIPASLGKEVQAQLGQLPRTYTEGYTGVVYAAKTTRPTKAQAVMLSLLDGYAKAHGVHYTVVDSIGDGGANGVFTTSEGMVVALDAEEGYLTRVATHEGWHYIREHMGQEAQGLQDAVLTLLRSTEGYDLETRVAEKQEQYKRIEGQELSREAALEELTADALYDAIATPEALGAFVSHAYENAENKNAFKQAMDQVMAFINRFVAEVKALAKKIAGKNPEARAMLEHEADWGESIIQEYNRLMEEAGKRERGRTEERSGKQNENTVAYDLKNSAGEVIRLSDEEIEQNKAIVANMEAVAQIQGNMFAKNAEKDFFTMAKEYFQQIGGKAYNPILGEVRLSEGGIRHLISQGITKRRSALLEAVKPVIEKGHIIHIDNNHKGNLFDTALIVAPVSLNETQYYMGVVIKQGLSLDNSYYMHDAVVIQKMKDPADSFQQDAAAHMNVTREESENPSIASILASLANYNREFKETPEKYSLRNVDTDMTEMQRVVEENERLQKLVGSLNAQLRAMRDGANGKAAVDRKAVWALAREMKAQYQSKVRVNDLGANLQKAFDAMANARTDTEGKSAMEAMAAIARDMLDKSENIDSTMYDEYADLRGYLRKGRFRLTDAQWAEAAKLYGSEKEFRKAAFGRWNIAARNDRNALSLDAAWEEMHEQWPTMFDQDASEGDKVQQVMAAMEAVRREVSNPYAMNLEEMTQYVTAEMYQKYLEAPTVKGAEARTQETARELEQTRAELEETRRELEQSRAEIAAARQEAQEDRRMTAEMVNAARKNAESTIERWRKARETLAEQRKARAEVIRQKGRILKKLNSPKPGSFVPYQMREAVTALLEALDYNEGKGVTIKREMLERARQEYEAVLPKRDANGSAVPDTGIPALAAFYNGDVAEAMQRLAQSADGKQLNRLSQEETIELRDILRSYAAMIINEDRLFMQKRRDSLQEAGDGLVARMLQRKAHKQRGKAAETVLNVTNRALLSPGTVFHIFEGTEMEPIWKAVRDAENTHTRHVAQGQAYMEAALKEYGVQEIINQSERKQLENGVEVTLHDGKKQKFRIQEAMYIYAAAKRERLVGTNHLLGGGIVFQKNSHPGEATGARQLTAEDLEAIAGKLTEKQKAFVDHMVQFLSRDTAEWGNQVTRELYGVEKFKESYYVPFKVARNYLRTDPASQQENRLKLGSFTKPLAQQASNPLEVQNFVEMWAAHMEQMSDYNAFVLPIEDMTRLMNYKTDNDTVRSVMQERYGNQVPDYILSFLRRLNGNAKSEMGSALVNKLVSGAKGAAVGGNLSVASQQATAVLRAYALIDAKYLVKGMGAGALSAAKIKKSYAEIMDWAPIATQKSWGYFDTNMTRGTYDRARQTAMGKLDDALGYLSQKGDELAFTMIWEAVKREVAAESGLTRGTEAYFRRCGERFTEVIDQTQVVDSIFQRTELATEKGLARLWTSFMSEPFKQYNMLWRAGWDLKEAWRSGNKAAIKRARNQMIRTSASVVLSSVAAAAAKSLISAMRDDDDEKKEKDENGKTVTVGVRGFGEKYWDAFGPNLLDNATGLLPLVGNWLGSFITGETYNSSSMDSALLDSITRMWQALGKGDYEMAWYRGLQVVSNATGLGLGNAYRDGKALFTTLVKTLQRDTLAGTAWDKSKPFATRLQAATKNYVYAKQEGDSRRASPAVFYDLLLDAWYAGGTGEEFQQVATAMLETGATVDGIASGFKSRLRGSEELVTKAADAYEQGKYSEYEKHVLALVRLGIGQKAAVSMVDSVLDSRKKATEEPEAQTWEMLLDELTDDDADLFSTKDLLEAIQRGDQAEADYLLGRLKESKEESTIRSGLTEAYRKEYVAAWEKGDTAAMKKISDLLLGLDVGYTEESIAKWPRDEMNADYRDAMESGDAGQVRTVIAAMKKEGYTDSDLRSKLTQDYKASYTQAWNAGNKTQAQSIATMLKGLAVGYTEDSFKEWRVDSLKADWDAAVEARDVNRLKTQITRQMEAGVNQKQIRDKVWNAYGEAYVMALAEGNTSTARQLAGLMLNTGAGLTTEEIPQKAVNKAHSIYENSVESGDLNTARQVLKYLNQAEDGDRLWDKLYNWAKDAFMDAYDSGEYADLEKNLVSMGFSQKTINGWKD